MKPDLYTKVILTAIAACLAFLAYKVGTSPFFAQPKVEATQPAAIEATPKPIEVVPAEQAQAPAPKVEMPAPPPPPPEPKPTPAANAAFSLEKPESPQVIVPRPKVAKLDIVGKQVQEKKLADSGAERKLQEEDAASKAEQQRIQKESDAAAALAERERKQAEMLAQEAEAGRKQKEKDDAEAAARKQKEKEEAARKDRERQRKEQEDRVKKMAKESENNEQTEDLKKRILKGSDQVITTVGPGSKLEAKISDKYAASIQAAIRPNITFDPDTISGNPAVEIQVGLTSDGSIANVTVVKRSGIASWDLAAVRALAKTERLPLDENGLVPRTLVINLRPRDR